MAVPVDAAQGRPGTEPWLAKIGVSVTIASSNATAISTATDTIVVPAPSAGTHLVIRYIQASNNHATVDNEVSWRNGSTGPQCYRTQLVAKYGVFAHNVKPDEWHLSTATALYLTTSAAGSVHYTVEYIVVVG